MVAKLINYINLKRKNVEWKEYPNINGMLKIHGNGKFVFGRRVRINSSEKSNPIGGMEHCIFASYGEGTIKLGDNIGISNAAIVSRKLVSIGDNVKIGGGVKIYDTDFHSLNVDCRKNRDLDQGICKAVIIEDDVFIGAHSIILKGVNIGRGSIIGAGSVVTRSVPAGEVWAGNPARYIKKIGE